MTPGLIVGVLLVQAATSRGSILDGPEWTRLDGRPARSQFECVAYREDFWSVSSGGGSVVVRPRSTARVYDPLPFSIKPEKDQGGDRRVLAVSDGWLVGFDAGEFGGGLWWFDSEGRRSRRLRPPRTARDPGDPYGAENVLGFATVEGRSLVLVGLNHLDGRSGRVFETERTDEGRWNLVPVAILDASPEAWISESDRLLVLTEGGMWTLETSRPAQHSVSLDLGPVGPANSLVRGDDGFLYIGLRHYVLGLDLLDDERSEVWFAPSACSSLVMRERCDCVRPRP